MPDAELEDLLQTLTDKVIALEGRVADLERLEVAFNNLVVNGQLEVNSNFGLLDLVGTDHVYIEFFPDGRAAGRKAYVGFPGAAEDRFTITNEISNQDLLLRATGTGRVASDKAIASLVDGATNGGLLAGAGGDVQLYRGAADRWQTPDSMAIDGIALFGNDLTVKGAGDRFVLADDATQDLRIALKPYAFLFIRDNTDGHSAILNVRGGTNLAHIVWEAVAASWAAADTDTKHCVFRLNDGGGDRYVIKNRRGGSRTYDIFELGIG